MSHIQSVSSRPRSEAAEGTPIPVVTFGLSLSAFFVISYLICVLGYLLFPSLSIAHAALSIVLPGFELLSRHSFFLGLVESFVWGWYVALVFGPLYNFFLRRTVRW
jgi:2TM family of unknown function (DUF5676)